MGFLTLRAKSRSRTPLKIGYVCCVNPDCGWHKSCPITLERAASMFGLCDCLHVRCERPMQSPFTVVFANELREACDCGCCKIDNMLDLREIQSGSYGLGPVIKTVLHGVAERWGFAPVINLRAVADKGKVPKPEMALRTAGFPMFLPRGSICVYTGAYNAQLCMQLPYYNTACYNTKTMIPTPY